MQKPIVVVGSINLDLVAAVERIPRPGETICAKSLQRFFGGKGANQAVAAARLGHSVAMVGNVGDDPFGAELRAGLVAAGVNTAYVDTVPGSSGVALITTAASGENAIAVAAGANALLTPDSLRRAESLLKSAGILLAQLEIPMESVEFLAELARQHGIPLMLDPAPARAVDASLLRKVTWITPNETETITLLGLKERELTPNAAFDCARALRSKGANNVVLKLGAGGSLVAGAGAQPTLVPAFKVKAVDTTAAGDAFNGAFAVALMRGLQTLDAARFASATAAVSVTRAGAQPSMPTAAEVDEFLASAKLRDAWGNNL